MRRLRPLLICLVLALPVALAGTEVVQYSRNSLNESGRWVSAKAMMQIGVMGARHFVYTRNALNRNRLNMNAWHAFNEVYYNRLFELGSVEFDFKLKAGAHLTAVVGRTPDRFQGVRFSVHPEFESMLLEGDRRGAFTSKRPLADLELATGWHRARLERRDGAVDVWLDGDNLGALAWEEPGAQFVGFRSGFVRAEVDDVAIRDADGRLLLSETFRNTRRYWLVLGAAVVLVTLLFLAILALARSRPRADVAPQHWVALTAFVLTAFAAIFLVFDLFIWSRSYIYDVVNPQFGRRTPSTLLRLEAVRQRIFRLEPDPELVIPQDTIRKSLTDWDLGEEFDWKPVAYGPGDPGVPLEIDRELIAGMAGDETLRIAFIGTSQTAGVGAEVLTDSMVARIHWHLSNRLPDDTPLWIVNFAIPGSKSGPLLERYRKQGTLLAPHLLVANLSYNDRDPEELERNLLEFVEINEEMGARTLFVLEAASLEKQDLGPLLQRHDILRDVAASEGLHVLDLHARMNEPELYDSGFFWWDQVHMTSLAQDLAAGWLSDRIAPHLEGAHDPDGTPDS